MFNINKSTDTKDQLQDQATQLVNDVKSDVREITQDVKQSASQVGEKLQAKGQQAKNEANNVIDSLKALLAEYTDSSKATEFKDQIVGKATELKHVVQDEVTHAYETGKARTVQTVQDKPIASLAVAAGVGLLIGYILGTKQSSK